MKQNKKLNEIFEVAKGKKVKIIENKTKNSIPYLLIDTLRGEEPKFFTEDKKYTLAEKKDILMVFDGANSGLVGTGLTGAVGSTIARLRLKKDMNTRYITYFLSFNFSNLNQDIKGSAIPHIKPKKLLELNIRYPSLDEQSLIVSAIETQFTRLDASVKALKSVQQKLEIYRKAVLKKAFESMKLTKLEKIADMQSGVAFKKSEYSKEGIRLFQIANVTFGKTIWNEIEHLPEDYIKKYPQLVLKEEDVLMALNRPLLNHKLKVAMLKEEDVPSILYQRVGRFIFLRDENKKFFLYYLSSPYFLEQLERTLQGVNIPFINKSKIMKFEYPDCDMNSQQKIVMEVESKFSVIDKVAEAVDKGLAKAERLRKSILKSAFEGKLVKMEEGVKNDN